jgi:hypothetical protein
VTGLLRVRAVVSRVPPTGTPLVYPVCGDWTCNDDEDWEVVGPDDEDYPAVKREDRIARYHEPRDEWPAALRTERARLTAGDPLWWGRPS